PARARAMKAVRPISGGWLCPGRFPGGRGLFALLLSIACVAAPAAAGATAQAGRVRELPSLGTALEASLAQGQSDDWQVELAASEFLDITVELVTPGESDEWPAVAVTAPGGATLSDSTEPNIVSGIDSWPRMVASFTTDRAGLYRL